MHIHTLSERTGTRYVFRIAILCLLALLVSSHPASAQLNHQWTWFDGTQKYNQSGVYGTMGAAAESNAPGARINAITWVGPDGDLWLFGGEGYDDGTSSSVNYLNDLWRYDIETKRWTWINGTKKANQDGAYSLQYGTTADSLMPGGRDRAVSWVGPNGDLWLFGGYGFADGETFAGKLNDLWRYDVSTDQWIWEAGSKDIDPSPTYYGSGKVPGGRYGAAGWEGPNGDLWLFGGWSKDQDGDNGDINDLWKYDVSSGTWNWIDGNEQIYKSGGSYGTKGTPSSSNAPPGRTDMATWTGPEGNLWFFGGSSSSKHNDLWKYDIRTGNWTWVSGSKNSDQPGTYGTQGVAAPSNVPGARVRAVSWKAPDGSLWLMGGMTETSDGFTGPFNDVWKYDISTNQWTWIRGDTDRGEYSTYGIQAKPASTNEIGARQGAASWITPNGHVWVFGGYGYATSFPDYYVNDLWRLTSSPGALKLDGNVGYARIPDAHAFDLNSALTLETWVKFDEISGQGWMSLMMKGNASDAYGLMLDTGNSNKTLRFLHNGAGSGSTDFNWTNISADTWYHVAATYDGTQVQIFIDGVQRTSAVVSGSIHTSSDSLFLGQQQGPSKYRLDGTLAETRIWSTARTTSEISDAMNVSISGNETDLAGSWLSRSGGQHSVVDQTDNGNNLRNIEGSYVTDSPPIKVMITGNEGWRFLSAPGDTTSYRSLLDPLWTQGYSGSDGGAAPASNVYFYDEASRSWKIPAGASNVMGTTSNNGDPRGKGSLMYVYGDDNNDGNSEGFPKTLTLDRFEMVSPVQVPLEYFANNSGTPGWNLVSNPYPVSIYWDQIVKDDANKNARDFVYIWDQSMNSGGGDYRIHTGGTMPSVQNFDGRIPQFQSFWVKATGSNANLNITASHQTPNTNALYKSMETQIPAMEISMNGEGFKDTVRVLVSGDGQTAHADIPIPRSLSSAHADLYLLDEDSQRFIARHLTVMDENRTITVPVDVDITTDGSYELGWNLEMLPDSWIIELEEVGTGKRINLRDKEHHRFSVKSKELRQKNEEPQLPITPGSPEKAKEHSPPKFRLHISTTPQEQQQQVPTKAALEQNYPNPFNPATVISYDVPEQSEVTLAVFDMLGQQVATLVNEQKSAGRYQVDFDASGMDLASGLYMYRLRIGSKVMTKKMTLIK